MRKHMVQSSANYTLVLGGTTINKKNVSFIENEDTYNSEILRDHFKNMKMLKEDIMKKRNASKITLKNQIESFSFDDSISKCNFDAFYDKCLQIINRYLLMYKEVYDVLAERKLPGGRAEYGAKFDDSKGDPRKENYKDCNEQKHRNRSSSGSTTSNAHSIDSNDCVGDLLYSLAEKNQLIHHNRFLFDYDVDSEIYTSSEEEIVIDGAARKRIRCNKGDNYKYEDEKNGLVGDSKDTLKSEEECDEYMDVVVNDTSRRRFEKRKINLLSRYPAYLRDLIRIVKIAKNREKKILLIKFLNKHMEDADRSTLHTLFNKLYLKNCYMNNKNYFEKKKKRLLYRIVRHNMLNYIYNNHDIFLEKLLKKSSNYNNLSVENIKNLFDSHECTYSDGKTCKTCGEKIKLLFYIMFYDNLNYRSILKNANYKVNKMKHLLTHIFIKKKERRKTVNVEYDICYHKDKYVYMLSKNNIFCHILHENYIRNNFNDLLLRIKNGSKGYNLLHIIFNKYKNKHYLDVKKLRLLLDSSPTSSKGHIKKSEEKMSLRESFYDILQNKIVNGGEIKGEKNADIFLDKFFSNFYELLFNAKGQNVKERQIFKDMEMKFIDKHMDNSDSDDTFLLNSISENPNQRRSDQKYATDLMTQIKRKNFQHVSIKKISKLYANVKAMKNVDDIYIDENTWDNNTFPKYYYINKTERAGDRDGEAQRVDVNVSGKAATAGKAAIADTLSTSGEEISAGTGGIAGYLSNTFEQYLEKLNEEIAIVVNSDDSDEEMKNSYGKTKHLMNYLQGRNYELPTNISNERNNAILERSKVANLSRNIILHPLINSKCIGFKISVHDITNRKLDMYCINNDEYVNAYRNTINYLKNNVNAEMKKNYTEYRNMKKQIKQNQINPRKVSESIWRDGNRNYINNAQNNENRICEYIVVIDENVDDDKYKIDIYNYADLTTYIVNSKKEKKKEFYANFIRNEIYTHKWINKLQFKLQNYSNIYKNSFFKKKHLKVLMNYLYGLLVNVYYEKRYDLSKNLLLSSYYGHYDPTKQFNLKNISYNVNQIYEKLIQSIRGDIINNKYIRDGNNITEENIQLLVNDYLLNYKWDHENRKFFDTLIDKYRYIFLYYLLYTYPKFLHILNIIHVNNFKENIKMALPEQDDKHVQDSQKDYSSQKKTLKSAKKNLITMEYEEKEDPRKFYLPFYMKYENNEDILNAFSLENLLLIDFTESFGTSLFFNILKGTINIQDVQNEIHPVCYKTILYYVNNKNSSSIKNKLTMSQITILFIILNAYICFVTSSENTFFTKFNIWKYMIYERSVKERNTATKLFEEKNSYFPLNFLVKFLETFLLKKNQHYIFTEKMKRKLMIYILLIQLCLTDNKLPVHLSLVTMSMGDILKKLNFYLIDREKISFNLKA
ncbi:hypothetical protein, conserved [Plasmodium ovale wallikeri]|uniref:Uncharacterized protein n=2 Tax=Plasmodium ovale TaxID=36330 RepID=A0A1A8ZG23_PLAOA|nr:hypothetical protein, conserved [Plasmodium ovale wallikeri]SBT43265.1 hypothetical protein, conserved [Plasmodium ovale wallikeri]SBT78394.1 conserved Plasmodium protein, unknown function [Plasmodium ovale]